MYMYIFTALARLHPVQNMHLEVSDTAGKLTTETAGEAAGTSG